MAIFSNSHFDFFLPRIYTDYQGFSQVYIYIFPAFLRVCPWLNFILPGDYSRLYFLILVIKLTREIPNSFAALVRFIFV
jgi:hypothetical protein